MSQPGARVKKANTTAESLRCEYLTTPVETLLGRDDVVALLNFDGCCEPDADRRIINTGCQGLDGAAAVELWTSAGVVQQGRQGKLSWSKTDDFIFLSYWLEDTPQTSLADAAHQAYSEILCQLEVQGYPCIQRIWNYISRINDGQGDQERYRLFCSGRYQAFNQAGLAEQAFPAASAIGQHASHSSIYLLAHQRPGRHFENPRQISAYNYPRQYGPTSPSFARATQYAGDPTLVFLSGTASVLGHATRHSGDPARQLGETFANIDALMSHIAEQTPGLAPPHPQMLKVYLRKPELLDGVRDSIRQRWGDLPVVYLQGDICRNDLALEIDGIFRCGASIP